MTDSFAACANFSRYLVFVLGETRRSSSYATIICFQWLDLQQWRAIRNTRFLTIVISSL